MGLLEKLATILIIAGVLALYNTYGRNLIGMWLGKVGFIEEWIGLFIFLAVGYFISYLVIRRMRHE